MRPLAILTSDLHFSHNPPVARSAEPDWYLAQKRYIDQLKDLQQKLTDPTEAFALPIIVAGDFFDRWRPESVWTSQAQLINFLIDELPDRIFAIPGQHDLPSHRYEERYRTPFGTLVKSGKIAELIAGCSLLISDELMAHPFPWGYEISPPVDLPEDDSIVHLAVVHAYIWTEKYGNYLGAPESQFYTGYKSKLSGYDAAVFGDNHTHFMIGNRLMNCGTFMRRKNDEHDYKPMIGILYDDAHIEPHFLDVSDDLWLDTARSTPKEDRGSDTSGFIESLKGLGVDSLDFRAAVKYHMDQKNIPQEVRDIVLSAVP